MDEMKLGTRIAELRKENNITQFELAEKLGVTDRAVSKWETGGSYPDITLIVQIADMFNVSVDFLLKGKPVVRQKFFGDCLNSKCNERINDFLSDGWKIVDTKLSGDGDGVCCFIVLMEKEIFPES